MRRASPFHQRYSRRAVVFGAVQGVAMSALVARLFHLQLLKTEEFRTLAEGNRIKLQLIPPPRGRILDRRGEEMASNEVNYRLLLDRDQPRKRTEESYAELVKLIALSDSAKERIQEAITVRGVTPVLIKEYLTWDEVSRLEFHMPDLPGASIQQGELRYYPLKELASHLIGYVGKANEEEVKDQPVLKLPEFKIGKSGAEKMFEAALRGKAGSRHLEVDAVGRTVRELRTQQSVPGRDINLTIDKRLQAYAAQRIAGESGAIVVMEVDTGNVLALVSMPSFDPNQFSMGIQHDYWEALNADKKTPLLNKALAGQYPPGSTFKMLVGLAGLDAGMLNPNSYTFCPGHFYLGSYRFNCWKSHGPVDLNAAIAQSCDTYFYTVAHRIGIEPIMKMARRFGLGKSTLLGLENEKNGLIPDPDWKRKKYDQPWLPGDTVNSGIGQGYVLATPIQLALMAARIASGKAVTPRLYVPDNSAPPVFDDLPVDPAHLALIRRGMERVVNHEQGTAYWKRIPSEPHRMAGKTGTSQVKRITRRGVPQEHLPWEERHHALFVAYAPVPAPKYAACVVIEHGGGGSAAAAPVARDVVGAIQELQALDAGAPVELIQGERPWVN